MDIEPQVPIEPPSKLSKLFKVIRLNGDQLVKTWFCKLRFDKCVDQPAVYLKNHLLPPNLSAH